MDTSKQNIAMVNCPQIQDKWEPKVGDWTDYGVLINIVTERKNEKWVSTYQFVDEAGNSYFSQSRGMVTWLPRLDQLLEMLPNKLYRFFKQSMCFAFRMEHWAKTQVGNDIWVYGSTEEQTLLKAVMLDAWGLERTWRKDQPRNSWVKTEMRVHRRVSANFDLMKTPPNKPYSRESCTNSTD